MGDLIETIENWGWSGVIRGRRMQNDVELREMQPHQFVDQSKELELFLAKCEREPLRHL